VRGPRFERPLLFWREAVGRTEERQRELLLQPLTEEFLPEYAEETVLYFRRFAEPPTDGDQQ